MNSPTFSIVTPVYNPPLDALRACRVGDCDLKVGRQAMEAARKVDWKASDANAQASRVLKVLKVASPDATPLLM